MDYATVAREYRVGYPPIFPNWLVAPLWASSLALIILADGPWRTAGWLIFATTTCIYKRREAHLDGYLLGYRDGIDRNRQN